MFLMNQILRNVRVTGTVVSRQFEHTWRGMLGALPPARRMPAPISGDPRGPLTPPQWTTGTKWRNASTVVYTHNLPNADEPLLYQYVIFYLSQMSEEEILFIRDVVLFISFSCFKLLVTSWYARVMHTAYLCYKPHMSQIICYQFIWI